MLYTKPANLIGSVVYNPLQAAGADVSISKGKIIFVGLPNGIKLTDVKDYTRTVYAAGTKEVRTLALAGVTVANSTAYTFVLQRLDNGDKKTYTVFTAASGSTTTTLAVLVRAVINNDSGRIVNATGSTTNVILTEISTDTMGFNFTEIPTGATNTNTTPHVDPSGTYAEAFAYDPTKAAAAGTYTKYRFVFKTDVANAANSGGGYATVVVMIFADQLDANYTAFDDKVTATVTASGITDAVVEPYVQIA